MIKQSMTGEALSAKVKQSMTGEALSAMVSIDVDIVMCLDITESMVMGEIIDMMKNHIKNFSSALRNGMKLESRKLNSIRLKIIAFRDWQYDGICADPDTTWFKQSEFFVLLENDKETEEAHRVADFLDSLEAAGGGDEEETSLEALAMAMRSDWRTEGTHMRHVVCLMTDDIYKPIENFWAISEDKRQELINRGTPYDLPRSFNQLEECWNCPQDEYNHKDSAEMGAYYMNSRWERLIVIAPDRDEWYEVLEKFQNSQFTPLFDADNNVNLTWTSLVEDIGKSFK